MTARRYVPYFQYLPGISASGSENRFPHAAFSPILKHKSFSGKSLSAASAGCP
jgi:hypothetical protein